MRDLPADEGLEGVLECHEGPHDYPVLRVLGDILLGEGAMFKRPPGPEAGEEECEPGAEGDVSGFAGGITGKMHTREGGKAGTSTWWWLKTKRGRGEERLHCSARGQVQRLDAVLTRLPASGAIITPRPLGQPTDVELGRFGARAVALRRSSSSLPHGKMRPYEGPVYPAFGMLYRCS